MNSYQFEATWGILCRNFDKNIENMKKTGEDYFDRFKKTNPNHFAEAINILCDNFNRPQKFPTRADIHRELKKITKLENLSKIKYQCCLACGNSGWVSLILGRLIGDNRIYERHFNLPGKLQKLYTKKKVNNIEYSFYTYAYLCRCEKAVAINHARNSKVPTINQEEYKELIEYYNQEAKGTSKRP